MFDSRPASIETNDTLFNPGSGVVRVNRLEPPGEVP